ncbi:DnaJ family domain-containing protein [Celerinatantimonas sp. YJH-8]|uniref:DnaJ family domain-containing protein n=1 Tax=Celerinatantimonas sp. YJH-8 TaxID=3228714 RepID=UPI0038CA5BC9
MSLIDQLAEKAITQAIQKGQLDALPGHGKPLKLDDDSQVPESLRIAYRILKNAGYLPPELEDRQLALQFCDLLQAATSQPQSAQQTLEVEQTYQKLKTLELRMRIQGIDTRFIHHYLNQLK